MGKVTPIRPHRPVVSGDVLNAQVEHLKDCCTDRVELLCGYRVESLGGLPYVFERLSEIVPPGRRNELSHSIWYVTRTLLRSLTEANMLAVLTCAMVLYERYTAESATSLT